ITTSQTDPNPTTPGTTGPVGEGAPTYVAVIEHRDGTEQLAIVDLRSGKIQHISPHEVEPRHPVWSPNGANLLYRIGDTLMLHAMTPMSDRVIIKGLDTQAITPYVFSLDGQWIAAALPDAVMILSMAARSGAESGARRIPMAAGCRVFD